MIKPGQYLGLGIFGTHAATPDLGVIQEEQLNVISLMMVTMRRMRVRLLVLLNKDGDDEDEER